MSVPPPSTSRQAEPSALLDLRGHVAVVTGGTGGIGLGFARGLVRSGAHVIVWGRDEDRGARALAELQELGHASFARVDVTDEASVQVGMAAVAGEHGRLDSCFANAGRTAGRTPLVETSLQDFRAVLDTNLEGTFLTLREAARQMIAAGHGGSLVTTASTAVIMGRAGGSAYAASKGGVVAMTKALAVELARHGIRVNAVVPGWVESGMSQDALGSPGFAEKVLPRIPAGRWGTGADFEGLAAYLASNASRYHTGDSLVVDGGFVLR